jgi:hypothetical protein
MASTVACCASQGFSLSTTAVLELLGLAYREFLINHNDPVMYGGW